MQIGNLTLPDNPYRLPLLLLDVSKIYQAYPKGIIGRAYEDDKLAKLLGYVSAYNGAYWNRLSALKHYGLLEGRPHVTLTELAKKLTTTQDEVERSGAYFEAVNKIALWRELYKIHGFKLPQQNLWKDIAKITECKPDLAHEVESFVRQAFEVDTNSIKAFQFQAPSAYMQVDIRPVDPTTIEIRAGPYNYQLPFTHEGLEMAIRTLKMIKAPDKRPAKPAPS